MKTSKSKVFHLYLLFLLISLIGNAAADFAFLWLAASKSKLSSSGIELVTGFYVGQSIGYIFLAPYISNLFKKLSLRSGAVLVDTFYILIYSIVIALFFLDSLSFSIVFILAVLMASLSSVHRNGVTFALLNKLSHEIEIKILIKRFSYVFNFTLLFGAAISGMIFYQFGFVGCISIAIISFIPMLLIYLLVFDKDKSDSLKKPGKIKLFKGLTEGFIILGKNKNLLFSSLGTSFAYIPGAIYPGLIAFYGKEQGMSDTVVSLGVSFGILVGTIAIPISTKYAPRMRYRKALAFGFIPTVLTLLVSLIKSNFYVFTLSFAMNCIGFTILNILTVMVRVKSVKPEDIPTLNTAYYAVMSVGQVLGTILLFPIITSHPVEAKILMIMSFLFACSIFYTKCTNSTTEELIQSKV